MLDVGCNEGLLTLALAVGCGCRSTTGIDIDPVLVAKACTNLSRTRTQLTQQMREAVAARCVGMLRAGMASSVRVWGASDAVGGACRGNRGDGFL